MSEGQRPVLRQVEAISDARMTHAVTRLLAELGATTLAPNVDEGRLEDYLDVRLRDGVARATACYELAILRHGFSLAVRRKMLPARTRVSDVDHRQCSIGILRG